MRRTITNLQNLVEIPESIILEAVKYIPEDEESGMRTVLLAADEYRDNAVARAKKFSWEAATDQFIENLA